MIEPLLCSSDAQALSKAREWLAAHPECDAVGVLFGADELFHVAQPA